MEGWGKIAAGVVLGVAGTVYATNKEVRKRLPKSARDLPENVRHRFETAVSAAREASTQAARGDPARPRSARGPRRPRHPAQA